VCAETSSFAGYRGPPKLLFFLGLSGIGTDRRSTVYFRKSRVLEETFPVGGTVFSRTNDFEGSPPLRERHERAKTHPLRRQARTEDTPKQKKRLVPYLISTRSIRVLIHHDAPVQLTYYWQDDISSCASCHTSVVLKKPLSRRMTKRIRVPPRTPLLWNSLRGWGGDINCQTDSVRLKPKKTRHEIDTNGLILTHVG
jgi:hypothetical protein